MLCTEEMTTSEILLRLASMRNELLQAVDDIEKISKNICYKAEQTEPQTECKMPYEDCEDCETHLKAQYGDCNKCRWYGDKQVCGRCRSRNLYAPKDESQTTSTPYKVDTSSICKIEPQTDCPKSCPSIDICTKDDMDCPWKKG